MSSVRRAAEVGVASMRLMVAGESKGGNWLVLYREEPLWRSIAELKRL